VSICKALDLIIIDKHFTASCYRTHFRNYILFATFRNYEDRAASTFGWKDVDAVERAKAKGDKNVGLMLRPNEYFIDCKVDYLLRYEHLEEDLNAMLIKLGHASVSLDNLNSFR
jgi:hypothetical protein